ncbi:hypothetical protein FRB96_001433 [Tulasnella sp. 330]|nr:hypothetical protein FRB96_001433 [Tulasnella sp. 330]
MSYNRIPQANDSNGSGGVGQDSTFRSDVNKQHNLPPKKRTPAVRKDISPPLWKTPLWKVIYTISFITLSVSAFYTYRLTQWKSQAGGWVNLMLGRSPNDPIPSAAELTDSAKSVSGSRPTGGSQFVLEDRLRELAEELGIHPRELVSAIQPIIPSASQTSIAAANPTPSDPIIDVLAGGDPDQVTLDQAHDTFSAVAKGFGAIMGADDPVDFEA